jgi:hypothetical protein
MSRLLIALFLLFLCPVLLADSVSHVNAKVYFISPTDGATVKNPIIVRFGLQNMGIAPAGVQIENTGHHHLVVDTGLPVLDQPVPSDDHHLHFGKGQTETEINLAPGDHTLQLLLGDYNHIPHIPPVYSDKISIIVE